jgi:hypothetical protein
MFNPKRMGDCDYSVPSKIFACRFSGGRNELEMATANALNPNHNPIPTLCCFRLGTGLEARIGIGSNIASSSRNAVNISSDWTI